MSNVSPGSEDQQIEGSEAVASEALDVAQTSRLRAEVAALRTALDRSSARMDELYAQLSKGAA